MSALGVSLTPGRGSSGAEGFVSERLLLFLTNEACQLGSPGGTSFLDGSIVLDVVLSVGLAPPSHPARPEDDPWDAGAAGRPCATITSCCLDGSCGRAGVAWLLDLAHDDDLRDCWQAAPIPHPPAVLLPPSLNTDLHLSR